MYRDIIVLKTHDYADLVLNTTLDCYLHSGLNFGFRTAHSHSNVTEKVPRWVRRDSSSSGHEMIVQSAPGASLETHVNAKNPEKKGCCSIASATGCRRRRTKQLVEKNWNSPNSYQRGFAGTTATNNGIAQGAPVGNRLCANQESLDPRSKPGALPTQLDRHGIVGTEMI
jgi:hypothetical protein